MRSTPGLCSRSLLAAALLALPAAAFAAAPHIVACDAVIQSHKRGLCANNLSADDFRAIAPGISWWYNWDFKPNDTPPAGVKIDFLPMVWGDRQADLIGVRNYLQNHTPRVVLAINEPNLKGQAFIPPEQAAKLFKEVLAIAEPYHLEVVGPQMALGSAPNASIKVQSDPITHKPTTYGWMGSFLDAFFFYVGKANVPAFSVHSYKDMGELRWAVSSMHKTYGKPIWVTEFADWNASGDGAERTYMMQAVDFLESTPYVQGYSWFKERVNGNEKLSILGNSGQLTTLGKLYVAMPVHEADLFYRIPGTLSAGRYTTATDAELTPGENPDSFAMSVTGQSATLDYHIAPTQAGDYTIALRVHGTPAAISISAGSEEAVTNGHPASATATPTGHDWETVPLHLKLAAGPQTLRVVLGAHEQMIDSLTFTPK